MSKAAEGQGSWVWRALRIAAIVVLVVSLLAWFLVDPLRLPGDVLEGLNQRASVIGMLTGAAGLVVSMLGLRAQLRGRPVDGIASVTETPGPGAPRRRTVLLIVAVPAVVLVLIVLAVVRDAPTRYEAEDGVPHNARGHYGAVGASNDAAMGWLNDPDSWVDIEVQAPRTGTFTAYVWYAAGVGNARHYVTVNGGPTAYLLDYAHGSWTTWSRVSIKLKLVEGKNTLRFQYGGPFPAELDYVEIV
jgi:hypothetical protein